MTLMPIPGVSGYLASGDGSIWSEKRGQGGRYTEPHRLRSFAGADGYLSVCLWLLGKRKTCRVHRLIALAFHGECPAGKVATHLDGNRTNNAPDNISYQTQSANINDKWAHGTMKFGEHSYLAKLSNEQAREMLGKLMNGQSPASVAAEFGVSVHHAYALRAGRIWKHLRSSV